MKRTHKSRRGDYLPRVEGLESRMQPGSILTVAPDLAALGATLDQSLVNPTDGATGTLSQELDLSLGSFRTSKAVSGGALTVTPYQVTHSGTEITSSLTMGTTDQLGTLNQGLGAILRGGNLGSNGGSNASLATVTPAVKEAPAPIQNTTSAFAPLSVQRTDSVPFIVGTAQGNGGGKLSGQWASYAGPAGTSLQKVAADTSSGVTTAVLYAAGWTNSNGHDKTSDQGYIIRVKDGETSAANVTTVTNPTAGSEYLAIGAAKNSSGAVQSVIVGGYTTDLAGESRLIVQSFSPDLKTMNWGVISARGSGNTAVNGLTVTTSDGTSGTVTYTGGLNAAGGPNFTDAILGQLDLKTGAPISGHTVSFHFNDSNGNALNTTALAVGVDKNSNVDLGLTFTDTTGNEDPAYAQVKSDFTGFNGSFSFGNTGKGGFFDTVAVDANGNSYLEGQDFSTGSQYDGFSYLIVIGVGPGGTANDLLYKNSQGQGVAYLWYLTSNNQHIFNWIAYSNAVTSNDQALMTTTFDDGKNTASSFGAIYFAIDSTGANYTAYDNANGGVNGSNNDYGLGLAIDNPSLTNPTRLWEVGRTSSPDLGGTFTGFQTKYAGDPYDGWIASFKP